MNCKKVIAVVVLFLLFSIALNRPAAAQDRDQDPEQLWNIGWELSRDSFQHPVKVRVHHNRKAPIRALGHTLVKHPQSDLLQELMHVTDSVILDELLV